VILSEFGESEDCQVWGGAWRETREASERRGSSEEAIEILIKLDYYPGPMGNVLPGSQDGCAQCCGANGQISLDAEIAFRRSQNMGNCGNLPQSFSLPVEPFRILPPGVKSFRSRAVFAFDEAASPRRVRAARTTC